MSTEVQTCTCGSIGADASILRLCQDHHRYFKGDKELISVGKIIRETWPIAKDYEKADPAVLEHARDRGIRVDGYVNQFVSTGTLRIPAGEWREVVELVQKFVKWYSPSNTPVHSQVMLHAGDIAGTADLIDGTAIFDLKSVYSAEEPTYKLQLGLYAHLYDDMYGQPPSALGIIHLTKRYATPKVIPLDVAQTMRDALVLLDMWKLVRRLTS